ncbi:hypothetical protein [Sphingomonas trueperi]|uniref:hypothetical protein n=1 Tax=Sphingomonas trueperi TaxID=53317 RepID=UPI000EB10952
MAQTDAALAYKYVIGTSDAFLTIHRNVGGAIYVGYIKDLENVKPIGFSGFTLAGAPTLALDLPVAGTTIYQATVVEIGAASAGQTVAVDASARRLSGTIAVTMNGGSAPINLILDGVLDPQSGRVDGTVTTADGILKGAAHGRLYGPGGGEIGLIFDLKDSTGNASPGVLIGRK